MPLASASISLFSRDILKLNPLAVMALAYKINQKREKKLAETPTSHQWPEGPCVTFIARLYR